MQNAAEKLFLYTHEVDAFGFDWGRLSLTVAPEVNGAGRFSGGVVDVKIGEGHARHNHPGAEENFGSFCCQSKRSVYWFMIRCHLGSNLDCPGRTSRIRLQSPLACPPA